MRRDAVERAEREAIHRVVTVVLDKVYGPAPPELHQSPTENGCRNGAETVQFSRRKREKLEALRAELTLWPAARHAAFNRHQHLRPQRRLTLGTVARMVDIATQFGRLACGLPWPGCRPPKQPEDFSLEAVPLEDALARVYGDKNDFVLSRTPGVG